MAAYRRVYDSIPNVAQNYQVGKRLADLEMEGEPSLLYLDGDRVAEFSEKPQTSEGWVNGAFFVLEPRVFEYIEGDDTVWEREPMEKLARDGQLMAYRHDSFWQCMDTLRDKYLLNSLWETGQAPWKTWKD